MIYEGECVELTQGRIQCTDVTDGMATLVDAVSGQVFKEPACDVYTDTTSAQMDAAYQLYGNDRD